MNSRSWVGSDGATTSAVGTVASAVTGAKSFNGLYPTSGSIATLIANAPESPSISTCPSGGAAATDLAATTPPAPGTFSTTNGLPSISASLAERSRANTSGLPPGAAAATSRTGLDG